jgi:hypothetical protein
MPWDYTGLTAIYYSRFTREYIVMHYGRKPDGRVRICHWRRVPDDIYPDVESAGLSLVPLWVPDGAGVQQKLP